MLEKRVFVAVDIPEAIRRVVDGYTAELRAVDAPTLRWTLGENLHLTLKFAGKITTGRLTELSKSVDALALDQGPFEVSIEGTGAFIKRHARSNILWLGVTSRDSHGATGVLESLMTALSASEDGRTPKPHLTIARLKDAHAARSVIDRHLQASFGPERFICEGLVIYESTLTAEGSRYSVLSRHSLRG